MRQPARRKTNKGRVSRVSTIQAPVGGWNTRDSITNMNPKYANVLDNFFPTGSDVILRSGSDDHCTGITGTVETLVSYRPRTGSHSLWGFAGTALYNVTAAGTVGAATVSGLTNARWIATNVTVAGGNYVMAVNGVDKLLLYDGATWTAIDGASAPAITGITTTTAAHVNVFKNRVWLVETGKLKAWYSAVGAITGLYTGFDLAGIFRRGGYLMATATWTLDAGTGIDDHMVFITSQGEVAIYKGTDPSVAADWALVGVFLIAPPLSRNCFVKYGGDLLLITREGVQPMTYALQSGQVSTATNLTDVLRPTMAQSTSLYASNYGWQLQHFPSGNMLLLNVPVGTTGQHQYVMNTTTRAWCRFTGWDAACFEVHNDELYYGTSTKVVKAWTGTSDNGANIVAEGVQAFSYLGTHDGLKHVRMVRPVIGWDSNPAEFLIGVDADFVLNTPTGAISFASTSAAVWDSSTWDVGVWSGDVVYNTAWYTAFAMGYAVAPHIKVSSSRANVHWASTDLLFEPGGVL